MPSIAKPARLLFYRLVVTVRMAGDVSVKKGATLFLQLYHSAFRTAKLRLAWQTKQHLLVTGSRLFLTGAQAVAISTGSRL
jgi:hypothetical protein